MVNASRTGRIDELRARLVEINADSQAVQEKASREGRDMTAAEQRQVEVNYEAFMAIEEEISRAQLSAMDAGLSAPQPRLAGPAPLPGDTWSSTASPGVAFRYAGATSMAPPSAPGPWSATTPPALRPHVEALGRFVKTGQAPQVADAMTLTPAEGGYGVSPQLDPVLQVIYANQSGLIRAGAKIVQRGINDSYSQPIATGLPAVGWVAEGDTRAATNSPAFTQVQPPRGGVYANVSASSWLEQDWSYGELGSWLIEEVGRAQGQEIGKQLIVGDGTNKPSGIATATTAATADGARAFGTVEHVLSGVSASLDLDSCVNTFFKLQPEYQERASWLMSPAAFAVLRAQKASTAGSYMMDVSIAAGGPPTLLGRPVFLDVNVAAPAAGALSVVVGDFSRGYSVVYYGFPVVIRDPYSVKGQLSFYAERRVGGKWMDTNAFKFIKCSA